MSGSRKSNKKVIKTRSSAGSQPGGKKGVLKLDSDYDFLKAFEQEPDEGEEIHKDLSERTSRKEAKNRHGMKVIDDFASVKTSGPEDEEDFESMLERSFARKKPGLNPRSKTVPLKKRLKRYPPVEKKLDLHGFKAVQAQAKARSFIQTCKMQGFFTIRVVVGKGLHSDFGPVLPDLIEDLVLQMKQEGSVLWFEWDKEVKSKSGSLIIYLKQFDQFD